MLENDIVHASLKKQQSVIHLFTLCCLYKHMYIDMCQFGVKNILVTDSD